MILGVGRRVSGVRGEEGRAEWGPQPGGRGSGRRSTDHGQLADRILLRVFGASVARLTSGVGLQNSPLHPWYPWLLNKRRAGSFELRGEEKKAERTAAWPPRLRATDHRRRTTQRLILLRVLGASVACPRKFSVGERLAAFVEDGQVGVVDEDAEGTGRRSRHVSDLWCGPLGTRPPASDGAFESIGA